MAHTKVAMELIVPLNVNEEALELMAEHAAMKGSFDFLGHVRVGEDQKLSVELSIPCPYYKEGALEVIKLLVRQNGY